MLAKETVDYTDGSHKLQGWLVAERDRRRPAPGLLVLHDYMGLGD